jgi:hypothetical protein
MGEIAEMIIDGILCQLCGTAMGYDEAPGYPRTCDDCEQQEIRRLRRSRKRDRRG